MLMKFESRLWGADVITNPPDTPDAYVDLLESTVVDLLDKLAPVQQGNRSMGKTNATWLSNEAIVVKR